MCEKKRFLIKTVFETAKNVLPRKNKSAVSKYLSLLFEEQYDFSRDDKTYSRFYTYLVQKNKDYNIDDDALYYLSRYIGYDSFDDFCNRVSIEGDGKTTFTLSFKDLSDKIQQTIITVTPTVLLPDFMRKNGLGILEMTLVLFLVTGGVVFSNGKNSKSFGFMSGWNSPVINKAYMYWDKDRYMATDSSSLGSQVEVVPMNEYMFKYFKKITRPDTLTATNSLGKVWYNKSKNHVEFFTSFGRHPENEKTLKEVSERILENYAGQNAILEE
ncbi:hypothetical protein BBH99_04335 [Chryseobacterium contaminans]|uniref:Uncharacterized protein n=1 Tax=Chryseobacterium contaminans TaxID=1423959 RepID=A0A1M6V2E4_9FLAO|nr:hypothetical protein [Chryseobacterium contaminans]OCA80323.1 hypothetical protein BBH99_04335 [Chryseobacterium contaminans]SHK75598.1 hypothetical protein SAMN05444407_10143 [Chryseobacterium contaminans]